MIDQKTFLSLCPPPRKDGNSFPNRGKITIESLKIWLNEWRAAVTELNEDRIQKWQN